jgi:hypothetical protein
VFVGEGTTGKTRIKGYLKRRSMLKASTSNNGAEPSLRQERISNPPTRAFVLLRLPIEVFGTNAERQARLDNVFQPHTE